LICILIFELRLAFLIARLQRKKIRSIPSDWGVETSEEEIDKVVYGAARNE